MEPVEFFEARAVHGAALLVRLQRRFEVTALSHHDPACTLVFVDLKPHAQTTEAEAVRPPTGHAAFDHIRAAVGLHSLLEEGVKFAVHRWVVGTQPSERTQIKAATRRFQALAGAYETLSDPALRAEYDAASAEGGAWRHAVPDWDAAVSTLEPAPATEPEPEP